MQTKTTYEYDTVILGAGPAGLSAAIYAKRGEAKVAIIDISMSGGQPSNYLEIENYPGFAQIEGWELSQKFDEHAQKFGVEKYEMQEIEKVDLVSDIKTVETAECIFCAKCVITATGAQAKKLGVPGEKEFTGRGVSYCAVCDGAFYKDKTVCVVGGGNAAVEEACYLTRFAKKVYIIHRRNEFRADKIVQMRAKENPKVEFVLDCVPVEIQGADCVNCIVVKNVKTNEVKNIQTDGVFPYIGFSPNVELFSGQIKQNEQGFLITDERMQTSQEGVWAAGDVRTTPLRQVITACADGAVAACEMIHYLDAVKEKAANPLSASR